ncbi:MAG: pyridoxal phosphate-dependent aminotransferase, partial [Gemmatimonadaceae bacterium]
LARRTYRLAGESAFAVSAEAARLEAAGEHVLRLEIGQPDIDTPPHIVEAAHQALRDGRFGYTPPAGIPELRDAIANHLLARGVNVSPERVVVAPGAKAALHAAMTALVEEGSDVLIPDPGFPAYASMTRFLGANPVGYRLDSARGFAIDTSDVERRITERTSVLIMNSPHNPTGGTADPRDLEAIAQLALAHNLTIISDEIYSALQFDGRFASVAALPEMGERTVIIDGFSKSHAMTGWRLGYAVLPAPAVERTITFMVNAFSCTAAMVQYAGVAALSGPMGPVRRMATEYAKRARMISHGLDAIPGISCAEPRGAFYAFPRVATLLDRSGGTSADLAEHLLHDHGVACLPGTAFGAGGEGHLRLSCTTSRSNIALALERIRHCAAGCSSLAA